MILLELLFKRKREGVNNGIIKNILKETLQYYILDFIYNLHYGKEIIFTGGTALRFCFGINRLSEDIDFDLEYKQKSFNKEIFSSGLVVFFKSRLKFENIEKSVVGKSKKIYLKFPVLYELGLAKKPESDKLYVKVEIENNISRIYETEFTPISKYNLNFVARNYSLPTLMASKIIAVLRRTFRKGKENKITFKGRDYYDLLWFFQKDIRPDMRRIKDVMNINSEKELYSKILNKVELINPLYLKEDLVNLFEDGRFIETYCDNYKDLIRRYLI